MHQNIDLFLVNCDNVINGKIGFCTCHSCLEDEGDCNLDNECQEGLRCGNNNCPDSFGFDAYTDCCYNAALGAEDFCSIDEPCEADEGDCDSHDECQVGLACGSSNCTASLGSDSDIDCCYQPSVGDEHFCINTNPCGEDEGDCDSHDECNDGLICGSNNCPLGLGFSSETDCCTIGKELI